MSIDNVDNSNGDIDYGLSIDEMLASGDPDLIEFAKDMQAEQGNPVEESADNSNATQSVDTDQADNDEPAGSEQEQAQDDVKVDGVLSRDGKHVIPYSELETTRNNLAEATRNLQAEQQKAEQHQAEIEKLHRQIELAKTKGVELPVLPEDEEITDDMLEELADISPEMGVLGRKMKVLLDSQKSQSAVVANAQQNVQAQQEAAPAYDQQTVQQQIAANPAMTAIMQDPALSKLAIEIEKDLVNDPQYTSLDKRYAEVAKRVGGAKGIDFAAKYGAASIGAISTPAPHEQSPITPHSLSDIPNSSVSSSAGKTSQEVLAEQSPESLHASMEGMTMAQIEALIAG